MSIINWSDPIARADLLERIGPEAYNREAAKHIEESTVAIVAGQKIRPVFSRFGTLYLADDRSTAYPSVGTCALFLIQGAAEIAIGKDDLDEALAIIQGAVGIETGDGAGQFFNEDRRRIWKGWGAFRDSVRLQSRTQLLADWLSWELPEAYLARKEG